jgi:CubicO group peptidase (beta-lactamase class C family)
LTLSAQTSSFSPAPPVWFSSSFATIRCSSDDQVFFHGYGETAPESHQFPTQNSLLRLCSLTKIFTADVLAKLVADETLRLDDSLQRYAPAGTVVPKRVRPITLADMATHTSGLPRELGNAPPNTPHFTFPDYRTRWRWLENQHLRGTPGTAALYSNVAFDFLGDALQSAAHKQYAALYNSSINRRRPDRFGPRRPPVRCGLPVNRGTPPRMLDTGELVTDGAAMSGGN